MKSVVDVVLGDVEVMDVVVEVAVMDVVGIEAIIERDRTAV